MERPCLITLWMQFQRARRALGSMPVVGSSCNEQHSQVQVGPQVEQEAEAEGEEQRQQGHHGSPPNCPSTPACLCFCTQQQQLLFQILRYPIPQIQLSRSLIGWWEGGCVTHLNFSVTQLDPGVSFLQLSSLFN